MFPPTTHEDSRGSLHHWYSGAEFRQATGRSSLRVTQVNYVVSHRGVLRGIKYTDVPPGQAKYITCVTGAVLDVVVDLRVGSPTFGEWYMERLDWTNPAAVYIPEGLGHAVISLTDWSSMAYLLTAEHDPQRERTVHPLDPDIGITWPHDVTAILSDRDSSACGLHEAARAGLLPDYDACLVQERSERHAD